MSGGRKLGSVLLTFTISATDLGAALNLAQHQAMAASGFTHVSVHATKQVGPMSWEITLFCANSQSVTRRGPGWVDGPQGGHWCPQPALCQR